MKLSIENLKWNIEITFGYAPALITPKDKQGNAKVMSFIVEVRLNGVKE